MEAVRNEFEVNSDTPSEKLSDQFEYITDTENYYLAWDELTIRQAEIDQLPVTSTANRWGELEYSITWTETCDVTVETRFKRPELLSTLGLTPDQESEFRGFRHALWIYYLEQEDQIIYSALAISLGNCMENGDRIVARLDDFIQTTNLQTNYGEVFGLSWRVD